MVWSRAALRSPEKRRAEVCSQPHLKWLESLHQHNCHQIRTKFDSAILCWTSILQFFLLVSVMCEFPTIKDAGVLASVSSK